MNYGIIHIKFQDRETMPKHEVTKIFGERKIRTIWDDKAEKWYFSVVDVIAVLTDSIDPHAYWRKLKQRLKEEGNQTVTSCHALKLMAADGKMRMTLQDLGWHDCRGVQAVQGA